LGIGILDVLKGLNSYFIKAKKRIVKQDFRCSDFVTLKRDCGSARKAEGFKLEKFPFI